MVDIQISPTSLSRQSVFNLVRGNGGTPGEAGLLTAISFGPPGGIGESLGGNPTVINDTPSTGDYSVGLWQINFRGGINQPVNPTRTIGGVTYTIAQLQQDVGAQARAALAILRGTGGSWSALSTQWGAFRQNPAGVSSYGQQLVASLEGTSSVPDTGGTTTDVGNPSSGLQGTVGTDTGTGVQGTAGTQGTTQATTGSNVPPPTGLNLSFAGSIQHVIFQFLLVIVGIALLLGGIYLLGSHK